MSRFSEESSHFYWPDGRPCFEVQKKDGSGMRKTTITDCRKLALLPSVTTILSCWPKTAITSYRLEQLLQAATTTPRGTGEPVDMWHSRIIAVSEMHRNHAADTGKAIHSGIENWLLDHMLPQEQPVKDIVYAFAGWMGDNGRELVFSERQLLNLDLGYCGTADLCYIDKDGRKVLADIKNQSVKDGKAAYYDTWAMQLAAYNASGVGADVLQSIVINRDKPEAPHVYNWTPEEAEQGWRRFRLCLEVWSEVKQYRFHPQQTAQPNSLAA
jgi:hypothetical protein